jgi:hypothetical protein
MAQLPMRSVREVLLQTVQDQDAKKHGGSLQQISLLQEVSRILIRGESDPDMEEAILTEWYELFRTGVLAWGFNLSNPSPPFFHVTRRGHDAIRNVSRDPSNPAGYLRHLENAGPLNPIAQSYVSEALECYVAGLFKAAAVMVGTAAESLILELRDDVVEKLGQAGARVSSELGSWKIKNFTDALARMFERIDRKTHVGLRDKFDAHWGALTHEIRKTRNDAGHPTSIEPVTLESVHASLLLLPILVSLCDELRQWVESTDWARQAGNIATS